MSKHRNPSAPKQRPKTAQAVLSTNPGPKATPRRPAPSAPRASAADGWAHTARFLTTASQLHELPATDLPEIAFVGRSNAGKSTAINALSQQRRLAFASKTPGRTQHVNLFALGPKDLPNALWADLPGYGYAAVERAAKLRWQVVMADYLSVRRSLSGVVLLVDSRLGFTDLDVRLLDWIAPRVQTGEVKLLVLLTKADKLTRQESDRAMAQATEVLAKVGTDESDLSVSLFSALKKTGMSDVCDTLHAWMQQAQAAAAAAAAMVAQASDAPSTAPVDTPATAPVDTPAAAGLDASMHTETLTLPSGITLSCRSTHALATPASGRAKVMFLHGFPEAAFVWDGVMASLGEGVQALAPNLRGYEASSAPADVAAYRPKVLIKDLVEAIEAWGEGRPLDLLVAHDWGGALAWGLAAQRPDLMRRLLIVNAPHPGPFLRELKHNPAQQEASAYMNFLCRPDAAALLQENDHARMWTFFTRMGGDAWLNEATRAQYRAVWQRGLEGPLNYYRASPLKPALDAASPIHRLELNAADITVEVPTTVMWAENDSALPPALLNGLEAWVPNLTIQRVAGATHWIVHEQPGLVVEAVKGCLQPLR